jgi:GTPase SAR1 family protein
MPEEKMPTGVLEIKTALELIEIAKKQGWLDRLFRVFSKEHTILVLGSSGVGKTNFIQSLTELVPPAIDALNRTQFGEKHRIKVLDHPFILQDTPGQELSASRRVGILQESLRKGNIGNH